MSELFLSLLRVALIATAVMAVVLVLRAVLPNLSKRARCALWVLVAVSLTVPLLPLRVENPFSVVPDKIASGAIFEERLDNYVGTHTLTFEGRGNYDEAAAAGREIFTDAEGGLYTVTGEDGVSAPLTLKDTLLPKLAMGWFFGVCVILLYAVGRYIKLCWDLTPLTSEDGTVYYSDRIPTPFILGVIGPRIYMPAGLSETERDMVLAHERSHIQRGDHIWKVLGYVLLAVYWFHPLCWVCYRLFCRDIELACDEKVVKNFAPEQRADYSQALLRCSAPERFSLHCPLAFGEVGVKERVRSVLNYKKPAFWVTVVAIAIGVAAVVAFATQTVRDYGLPATCTIEAPYGGGTVTGTIGIPPRSGSIHIHDSNGVRLELRLVDNEGNIAYSAVVDGRYHSNNLTIFELDPDKFYRIEVVTEPDYWGTLAYVFHDGKADCNEWCTDFLAGEYHDSDKPQIQYVASTFHAEDLPRVMASAKPEELTIHSSGKTTTEQLAQALHGAVHHGISEDEAMAAGYQSDRTHWMHSITYSPTGNSDEKFGLALGCGPVEDIVCIRFGHENAYFRDETLYEITRYHQDTEQAIDQAAYALFEDILTEWAEKTLDVANNNYDNTYAGYELHRFVPFLRYDEEGGTHVVLYAFDYAYLPRDTNRIMLVGGMHLDGQMRVHNVDPYGYLIVRYRGTEVVQTAFGLTEELSSGDEAHIRKKVAVYFGDADAPSYIEEMYPHLDESSLQLLERMEQGETTLYQHNVDNGFYPLWMADFSEIACDGDLNCTIVTGRELTYDEIIIRNDIMSGDFRGYPLEPHTKATYGPHGYLQNIYYEIPNKPGEYQLSPPGY